MNTKLRGRTGLTLLAAKYFTSMQAVPIEIEGQAVFMDLRSIQSHEWLKDSPWDQSSIEPEEQAFMRRVVTPAMTVYDIGANLGLHTALLSKLVGPKGHVYSFEPNPKLRPNLMKTAARLGNVTVFEEALSDTSGEALLFAQQGDHSLSRLTDWRGDQKSPVSSMPCRLDTLDRVLSARGLPSPDFIKIDVEGAELKAFRGASRMLNQPAAPVIMFEANTNNAKAFGCQLTDARDFLLNSLPEARYSWYEIQENGTLKPGRVVKEHCNLAAVPELQLPDLVARLGIA
jgi:FkbM family methyltransferase